MSRRRFLRQSIPLQLATQHIDNPQNVRQSQRRFADLKIHDEARTTPCGKGQLEPRQTKRPPGSKQCIARLLGVPNGCQGKNFPFGKLSIQTLLHAGNISRSGNPRHTYFRQACEL